MRPLAARCGIGTVIAVVAALAVVPGAIAAPPANDDFAAAQDVGAFPVDISGTTVEATVQPGEDGYFEDPKSGESVWYRWTAPADMRVWFDNCGAPTNTYVHVYQGSALGSLKMINTQLAHTACEDGGVFGRREEFKAKAGTEYRIRVYSQLYADGPFHLRLQRIDFDGSLTQAASRRSVRKGKTVTYTVDVANLGNVTIYPWIVLITSKPGRLAQPVEGTRYVSLQTTAGSCERETFFLVHVGALCKVVLTPGESVRITAKVRPSRSLTHWVELDYSQEGNIELHDDVPSNNSMKGTRITTTVKKKPKRHRHHR